MEIGPFDSSEEFFKAVIDPAWDFEEDHADSDEQDEDYLYCVGMRKFFDIVFASEPFNHSGSDTPEKEAFYLRHDNLHLQNIFCPPDGTTGTASWPFRAASALQQSPTSSDRTGFSVSRSAIHRT